MYFNMLATLKRIILAATIGIFATACMINLPGATTDDDDNDDDTSEYSDDDDDNDDESFDCESTGGTVHETGACIIPCESGCPEPLSCGVWPICMVSSTDGCENYNWITTPYGCYIPCDEYDCPDDFYCADDDPMYDTPVCLWDSTGGSSGGDSCGCCENCSTDCDWCGNDMDCFSDCYGGCMSCCESCY